MKKIFIILTMLAPIFANGDSILDILEITPSDQSVDFVSNKKQFQLHTLITEQRHPKTMDLSQKIQANTLCGIEALLNVDEDISKKILELVKDPYLIEQAAEAVKNAILRNQKVYIYGCGATGRLAKQMESSFWRPFWKKVRPEIKEHFPNIENRLIGEMTGADRALISSLEGFEDLQLIGKLQLEDHQIQKGDVVFAITEGGETSSVIGTILAALSQYDRQIEEAKKHLYFIYNNPDAVLLDFERSRLVLKNESISKICLFTGPQSITGSTRMQATTIETFVMGVVLEEAIYQLLESHLSKKELENLGFCEMTIQERLLSFLPIRESVYNAKHSISQFTDLETSTYRNKRFSTYFAQNALITVFIDSTERAPTFRLLPLDTVNEVVRKSWIQVWTPAKDKLDAWANFLGRPFYGLNREMYETPFSQNIEDPYLKAAALRSLDNAGHNQQFLYDFSNSNENFAIRGPKEGDLGVLVLFANEIAQLKDPSSAFRHWFDSFMAQKANVGIILVSSDPSSFDDPLIQTIASNALIIQLSLPHTPDPLSLRQHIGLKMLLNAHSTAVMAKLGRVVGNTMTNVNPGNLKLIGRATFLIASHVNDKLSKEEQISYADANAILFDAIDYGKKTQKIGQNAEVGLSIIRILEALKNQTPISWEIAEKILQTEGLESYLQSSSKNRLKR